MKTFGAVRYGILAIVLASVASATTAHGQGFNFNFGGFQGGFQAGFQGGFQGGFNQFGGQGGFQGGFNQFGGQGGFQGFQQFGGQSGFQGGFNQFGGGAAQPFSSSSTANAQFSAGSVGGAPGFLLVTTSGGDVLAIDAAAIASCIVSGLPVALSQRELILHTVRASTHDANARLFRLRAEADRRAAAPSPHPAVASGGKGKVTVQPQPMEMASDDGAFTLYASGGFASAEVDWRGIASGFEAETWSGTLGAEMRLTDHLVLGLAGTYLQTDGDFDKRGSVDLDGFALSAYLSWTQGHFYADMLYSFGSFEEDIHRRTGLGTTARAEPDSENHSVEFNTGYNFHIGSLITGPFIGLDYRNGELDGYSEHGAGRANLAYEDQKYDSLVTRVGWQASCRMETGFGAVTPQIRAAWERENLNSNELVRVSLADSPYRWLSGGGVTPDYSVRARTVRPDEDYLNVGGGILIEIGTNFILILDYEGHLLRSNSEEHFASITASLKF